LRLFLIICFSFLILGSSFAQVELVEIRNPVYNFLKRMQLKNVIPEYNSSISPLSRGEVAGYLNTIKNNQSKLTSTDKKFLKDYEVEFEYDMTGQTKDQRDLFTKSGLNSLTDQYKQKHIYFSADSNVTFFGDAFGFISGKSADGDSSGNNSDLSGEYGFSVRGTVKNSVAYYLRVAEEISPFEFSYIDNYEIKDDTILNGPFNLNIDADNFNTYTGYLRYQTAQDWLALTFGNIPMTIGYGYIDKIFMSQNGLPFSYGKIDLSYKALNYSFTYASLKGDSVGIYPYITARPLSSKNIATHNLNINFSKAFRIGLWESIVISEQPFSFTYLNPISFLISADLSSGEQQSTENNSLLGIETEIIPVKNLSFQGALLIDDLTFGTITVNDSLNENKFGYQIGGLWTTSLNINVALEFTHLDPFVYSQRYNKSTYTNYSKSLGHSLPPNSDEIAAKIVYDITNRLQLNLLYRHQRSGEGIVVDSSGVLQANYGGNINFGLGDAYLRTNKFLDGVRINRDLLNIGIYWEPYRQLYLTGNYELRMINNLTDNYKTNDSYFFAAIGIDL
jgi:hypothetical protein